LQTRIIYRGEYPPPKHQHGETISGYGIVQSRRRIHDGWEYDCYSKACKQILFVTEADSEK
jgi:hypothetical protein